MNSQPKNQQPEKKQKKNLVGKKKVKTEQQQQQITERKQKSKFHQKGKKQNNPQQIESNESNASNSNLIPIDKNLKNASNKLSKLIAQKPQPANFQAELKAIWTEIDTPFLHKIAIKKIGSRLIQMLLKYSDKQVQQLIVTALLFEDLVKAKYGHFVFKKIFKLKCCSKEQQEKIFSLLKKSVKQFIITHEGAQVIDSYLQHLATPNQINQLKGLFLNNNPLEKDKNEEELMNMANKVITNGTYTNILSQFILSQSLNILIPIEKEQVIQALKEQIYNISLSKEGIKLCLQLIQISSAKDRKIIVKSLKGKVMEMILFENSKSYLVILKLLTCIDDTVLLKNNIINEIKANIAQCLEQKNGILLIESLLNSSQKALKEYEKDLGQSTSKKEDQQRKEEVLQNILPDIIAYIEQNFKQFLTTQQSLIISILQYIINENCSYVEFIEKIWFEFKTDCNDQLRVSKIVDNKIQNQDNLLICNQNSHRILKFLVKMQNQIQSNENLVTLNDMYLDLYQITKSNFNLLIYGRSIFVIIALIENTSYAESVFQQFIQIQQLKQQCKSTPQLEKLDSPGIKILKKLIQ